MDRAFRKGWIELDFPTAQPEPMGTLLVHATRLFATTLPFLALLTLIIVLPGKLALQAICEVFEFPVEGVATFLINDFGDLILGALVAPAAIFGLVRKLRRGDAGPVRDALRWGRRQWGTSVWNRLKAEITIMLWGALLVIPGVVAMIKLIFVDPIVAIEADRESQVLARSRALSQGRRWRIFVAVLPALPLSLVHMLATLRTLQYSRWLSVPVDVAFTILDLWMLVMVLLLYLEPPPPGTRDDDGEKAA